MVPAPVSRWGVANSPVDWPPACLQFKFEFRAEDPKASINVTFARRTDTMPQPPKVRAFCLPWCCHVGPMMPAARCWRRPTTLGIVPVGTGGSPWPKFPEGLVKCS